MIKFSNEVILFGETCVCFGVDPHVPSFGSLGGLPIIGWGKSPFKPRARLQKLHPKLWPCWGQWWWTKMNFFCGGPYFQTPILVLCISFCSVLPRLQHLQNWRNHTPTCDKAWQDANFLGSEKPWSSRLWTPRILGVSFLGVDVYPHVLKSWGPIKTRIVVSSRGQLELTSGEMGKWFLTINPDSKIHSRCSKIEVQETTISVFLSNSIHDGVANFAPSWDFLGSWGTDSWPSPILW